RGARRSRRRHHRGLRPGRRVRRDAPQGGRDARRARGAGRGRRGGAMTTARRSADRPRPPSLPERALWVNGALVRGEGAALSLFDRGARDGEGIFDTLRVYGGQPFRWMRHLERLVLAAAELGFPVPPAPATLRDGLARVVAANQLADASARITVTRGVAGGRPTRTGCWIEAEPVAGRLWS